MSDQEHVTDSETLTFTCFASAAPRTPQAYMAAAAELGTCLARHDLRCCNGGGATGCMGALNEAVKSAGGRSLGVIHKQWIGEEEASGLDKLIVVDGTDLSERKRLLLEAADALICLPGGVGTLDELFQAVAGVATGLSTLPVVLINTDGYYDGTLLQLRRAEEEGLLRVPYTQLLHVVKTPEEAVQWAIARVPAVHTLRLESAADATAAAAALNALPTLSASVAEPVSDLIHVRGSTSPLELLGALRARRLDGRAAATWVGAAPDRAPGDHRQRGATSARGAADAGRMTSPYGEGLLHGAAAAAVLAAAAMMIMR